MLNELTTEYQAEEQSSSKVAAYTKVYRLMRYPGSPYQNAGHYCWLDPKYRYKHYKLYPYHLSNLIKHVQEGKDLECHANLPREFRDQIREEEQRRADQKQNKAAATPVRMTPNTINIIQAEQARKPISQTGQDYSAESPRVLFTGTPLDVTGYLDTAVKNYSNNRSHLSRRKQQKPRWTKLAS